VIADAEGHDGTPSLAGFSSKGPIQATWEARLPVGTSPGPSDEGQPGSDSKFVTHSQLAATQDRILKAVQEEYNEFKEVVETGFDNLNRRVERLESEHGVGGDNTQTYGAAIIDKLDAILVEMRLLTTFIQSLTNKT
jgi:hypothetical protein